MTRAERYKLRQELLEQEAEAAARMNAADAENRPFEADYQAAAEALAAAYRRYTHGYPGTGETISKQELFGCYDRRMWAGVARNPTRTKLHEMELWHKNIVRELKLINTTIERMEKHADAKLPKPSPSTSQPSLL